MILILSHSCSQDTSLDNQSYELNKKTTLKETTSNVSDLMLNMGVTKVKVTNVSNSVLYGFDTAKGFWMNGEFINLSDHVVELKEGKITLKSNPTLSLSLLDNQPYVYSEEYTGFVKSDNFFKNNDFNVLLLFMKEMITEVSLKVDAQAIISNRIYQRQGCSFWDTYYVYGTGGNLSVSEANLQDEIQEYSSDLRGCRAIGEVNSACLWGSLACVATQAFCCD